MGEREGVRRNKLWELIERWADGDKGWVAAEARGLSPGDTARLGSMMYQNMGHEDVVELCRALDLLNKEN